MSQVAEDGREEVRVRVDEVGAVGLLGRVVLPFRGEEGAEIVAGGC